MYVGRDMRDMRTLVTSPHSRGRLYQLGMLHTRTPASPWWRGFVCGVCMHACMYACMHVWMHVCMCACVHVCMCACMQACRYACMYRPLGAVSFRSTESGAGLQSLPLDCMARACVKRSVSFKDTGIMRGCRFPMPPNERLVEYGWKPHQYVAASRRGQDKRGRRRSATIPPN